LDAFGQVGCSRGRCLVAEWMFSSAAKLVIFSRGQLMLEAWRYDNIWGIFSGYNWYNWYMMASWWLEKRGFHPKKTMGFPESSFEAPTNHSEYFMEWSNSYFFNCSTGLSWKWQLLTVTLTSGKKCTLEPQGVLMGISIRQSHSVVQWELKHGRKVAYVWH
jgi:hypothetical protein